MILVVDMNCKKNSLSYSEFVLPIVSIVQEIDECFVKHHSELTLAEVENCNRIILSGTPLKDNANLDQRETFSWLRTNRKPDFGICAGMQTIGAVFGLVLIRSLEIGMTPIVTMASNPLFSGSFRAYSLHNYCVESSDEFEVLAESEKCVQAIKHKEKPLYGVLFHPEVRNAEILRRFVSLN